MSDNFHFDLTGVSLSKALDIAFSNHKKAIGWEEEDGRRLILFWAPCPTMTELPAPMDAKQIESFVEAWLAKVEYGPQPGHDGDNGKGWRVYNEAWTHVGGRRQAFVAIEPVWLMYGK